MTNDAGYARVNGLEMYYEIHGAGEPLVVLPGAYMTVELMGDLVAALATRYCSAFPRSSTHDTTERGVLSSDISMTPTGPISTLGKLWYDTIASGSRRSNELVYAAKTSSGSRLSRQISPIPARDGERIAADLHATSCGRPSLGTAAACNAANVAQARPVARPDLLTASAQHQLRSRSARQCLPPIPMRGGEARSLSPPSTDDGRSSVSAPKDRCHARRIRRE